MTGSEGRSLSGRSLSGCFFSGREGMIGRCRRRGSIALQARRPLPSLGKAWVLLVLLLPLALGPTSAQQIIGEVKEMEAELDSQLVPTSSSSKSSSNDNDKQGALKGLPVGTSKKDVEANGPQHPTGASKETCDLTHGQWVRDDSYPLYSWGCKYTDHRVDCIKNGRPDRDYEHWRWAPHNCPLPKFDSQKFIRLMRNKTLMFIGDSLIRNQFQSLLCLLNVEGNFTMEGIDEFKQHIFFAPSLNMKIHFYRDIYLAKGSGGNKTECPGLVRLHLDSVGGWFPLALKADVVVLSTGAWWRNHRMEYVRGGQVIGYSKCGAGKHIPPEGPLEETLSFCAMSLKQNPEFKGILFVASTSPSHFIPVPNVPVGTCTKITQPNPTPLLIDFDVALNAQQVKDFLNSTFEDGKRFKFFDIVPMSSYRRDGHPSAYNYRPDPVKLAEELEKYGRPIHQDCFHWCVPGVVDNWNEMLLEYLNRMMDANSQPSALGR